MLIAFTGYKQSGKTVSAKHLVKHGFERINFKDCLVEEVKKNFPDLLRVIGDDFETKPPALRALLQNYGTEVRRAEDANYWVKRWKKKVKNVKNIVVDDCRFINEAEAVKTLGGTIIRIYRPGYNGDWHKSEQEMNSIKPDYTIFADELKDLIQQVDSLYAEITQPKY